MSGATSRPRSGPKDLVFPDKEDSNWEWDEEAGQYFLHRFYKHQPDLNIVHPAVREEIARIAGFWLQLGLSGFRVDAVPFLLETLIALQDEPDSIRTSSCATCVPSSAAVVAMRSCSAKSISSPRSSAASSATRMATNCTCA